MTLESHAGKNKRAEGGWLSAMLDNLCCIPRNYMVGGEKQLSGVVLGIHTLQIAINKYMSLKKKASFLST